MVPTCLCTGTAIWHVERSETFTSSTSLIMPHQQHEKNNTVNNTHTHNRLTTLCLGLPGWAGTRRNVHPLTPILIIRHP